MTSRQHPTGNNLSQGMDYLFDLHNHLQAQQAAVTTKEATQGSKTGNNLEKALDWHTQVHMQRTVSIPFNK
jgi:hypothetical protein